MVTASLGTQEKWRKRYDSDFGSYVSTLLNCERRIIAGNAPDAITHDDREETATIGQRGGWSGV